MHRNLEQYLRGHVDAAVNFLTRVALQNETGWLAFTYAQGPEFIFQGCLNAYIWTDVWEVARPKRADSDIFRYTRARGHPLLSLVPKVVDLSRHDALTNTMRSRCHERRLAWRKLGSECAETRLRSWIDCVQFLLQENDLKWPTKLWDTDFATTSLFDLYLDLLEYLQSVNRFYSTYGLLISAPA